MRTLPKQLVIDQVEQALRLGSRSILVVIEGDRNKAGDFHHALMMYLGHSLGMHITSNSLRREIRTTSSRIIVTHTKSLADPMDAHRFSGMNFESIIFDQVMSFHTSVVKQMSYVEYIMSRVRPSSDRRK